MISHVCQLVSPGLFSIVPEYVNPLEGVIVRPVRMSVCHADQRYFRGQRDMAVLRSKLPMALIHECAGLVMTDNTGLFRVGELVGVIPNIPGVGASHVHENYMQGSGFASSTCDGFAREVIWTKPERLVALGSIEPIVGSLVEFVSVAVHAITRLTSAPVPSPGSIGIWGDGSLGYVVGCVARVLLPETRIVVVGRHEHKLALFSFATETHLAGEVPPNLLIDHAFECVGGRGIAQAVSEAVQHLSPQGILALMGVHEAETAIRTRDVQNRGIVLMGCSRSGRMDFELAVQLLHAQDFRDRLRTIISDAGSVKSERDLQRVFEADLYSAFKTSFAWHM